MQGVEFVVIMLAVSAALRLAARRLGGPHTMLLESAEDGAPQSPYEVE